MNGNGSKNGGIRAELSRILEANEGSLTVNENGLRQFSHHYESLPAFLAAAHESMSASRREEFRKAVVELAERVRYTGKQSVLSETLGLLGISR